MPEHRCHASGCEITVPPKMFMCPRHWRMLPGPHKAAILCAYRPGQESDKRPSAAYIRAAMRAIERLRELTDD